MNDPAPPEPAEESARSDKDVVAVEVPAYLLAHPAAGVEPSEQLFNFRSIPCELNAWRSALPDV